MFRRIIKKNFLNLQCNKNYKPIHKVLTNKNYFNKFHISYFSTNEVEEESIELNETERDENQKRNVRTQIKQETIKNNLSIEDIIKEFVAIESQTLKSSVDKEIHEFLTGKYYLIKFN